MAPISKVIYKNSVELSLTRYHAQPRANTLIRKLHAYGGDLKFSVLFFTLSVVGLVAE